MFARKPNHSRGTMGVSCLVVVQHFVDIMTKALLIIQGLVVVVEFISTVQHIYMYT